VTDSSATSDYSGSPLFVNTDGMLRRLCDELRRHGRFGFDTEFIRERSYIPQLCLVQVATDEMVALIDCLAVNMSPFETVLLDPDVQKIVHAGGQDFEICFLNLEGVPSNIFDVQIAAGLVGMQYPLSYAKLVKQMLDVDVPKEHTFTDWSIRPLSNAQINYAAGDVVHLHALHKELSNQLEQMGRMDWMKQEMLSYQDPRNYDNDPRRAYTRVRGAQKLSQAQLAILRELAAWREQAARRADCPPRTFLKDEAMIGVVRSCPNNLDSLASVRFFPKPIAKTCGAEILGIIKKGKSLKPSFWPDRLAHDVDAKEKQLVDRLLAAGHDLCQKQQLAHELLGSRRHYTELAKADLKQPDLSSLKIMSGWRGMFAGKTLLSELTRTAVG